MDDKIPPPSLPMENLNRYSALIKTLNAQAAEQDIYLICRLQEKRSKRVEAVGQEINEVSTARMKGLGLHLFDKEGRSVLTSTDNLEDESRIKAVLEQAINSIVTQEIIPPERNGATKSSEILPSRPLAERAGLRNDSPSKTRTKNPEIFALKPQKDQINLAKDFNFNAFSTPEIERKLCKLNKKIEKLSESIGAEGRLKIISRFNIIKEGWRITRSDGTDVSWGLPRAIITSHLTYEQGGRKVDDYLSQFSPGWGVFTDPEKQKEYLQKAAFVIELLRKSIDKPEYPAGNYPLLVDAHLGGFLAHEAFGHAAESDIIYNDSSVLGKNGRLQKGIKVASSIVSIIDETRPNTWSYQPYSAFGIPRRKVEIVKKGILQESLGDVFSGFKIGDQIRGASRIESYGDIPLPRMSRTFIAIKGASPLATPSRWSSATRVQNDINVIQQALLKAGLLKDRVLVLRRSRGGGQVDCHAGTFMFGFTYLYEITPDSIRLFRGSSFSGKTLEALKAIKAGFGKVDIRGPGWCGKQGQYIPDNSGANEFIFIEKTPYVAIGGS